MNKTFQRILEAAVVVAIAVLVWSNLRLRADNQALRRALEQAHRAVSSEVFHPGEPFEFAGLVAPDGTVLPPAATPPGLELVVVADPQCGACESAVSELRAKMSSIAAAPLVVSNGSAVDTTAFAQRLGVATLTFRLSESIAPGVRTKFSKTPQVLLVSRGRVAAVCATVAECAARVQPPR